MFGDYVTVMSLSINDLKKDVVFLWEDAPHKVLDVQHKKMARQGATVEAKFRNLINGSTITRTFFPSERLQEAEVEKREMLFLYEHRGEYCFVDPQNRSNRVMLSADEVEGRTFLKPNLVVTAEYFDGTIINILLPIKVEVEVVEAPPGIKGDTASGGSKAVKIETGATIQTPLFINAGDIIRINTQKGEYVERVEKSK